MRSLNSIGSDVFIVEEFHSEPSFRPEEKETLSTKGAFTSEASGQDPQTSASGLTTAWCSQPAPLITPVSPFLKVQQDQNGASTEAGSVPQVLAWLDTEVKARLVTMDTKLDRILHNAGFYDREYKQTDSGRVSSQLMLAPSSENSSRPTPPSQRCPKLSENSSSRVAFENGGADRPSNLSISSAFSVGDSWSPHQANICRELSLKSSSQSPRAAFPAHASIAEGSSESLRISSALSSEIGSCKTSDHIMPMHHAMTGSRPPNKAKLQFEEEEFLGVSASGSQPVYRARKRSVIGNFFNKLGVRRVARKMASMQGGFWSAARLSNIMQTKKEKGSLRRAHALWHFLEDEESSLGARWYADFMNIFVVTSIFCTVIQSTDPPIIHGIEAAIFESSVDAVFLVEFLVRFSVCPSWLIFMMSPFNALDLMLGSVLVFRATAGPNLDDMPEDSIRKNFFLCLLPTLRMMKTLRRFQTLHLIFKAFESAVEALPVLLWTLMVAIMVFSTLIFWFEPRSNIPTWPTSIWLTIVTMSTVGYGDVSPVSPGGTIITAILIIISVLYMAMPIGIIGQTFGSIWHSRDRILLMRQTRKRLLQWGYTVEDIPIIFALFDQDNDGEVDLQEFRTMLKEMGLGIREERVLALFDFLDVDAGGAIDDKEFVRNVFPQEFHRLYQVDIGSGESDDQEMEGSTAPPIKAGRKSVVTASPKMLSRSKTLAKLGRAPDLTDSTASSGDWMATGSMMSERSRGASGSRLSRLSRYVLRKKMTMQSQNSSAVETLARRVTVRSHASHVSCASSPQWDNSDSHPDGSGVVDPMKAHQGDAVRFSMESTETDN